MRGELSSSAQLERSLNVGPFCSVVCFLTTVGADVGKTSNLYSQSMSGMRDLSPQGTQRISVVLSMRCVNYLINQFLGPTTSAAGGA